MTTSTADREIVLTRLLNAPRELVWEVWTNPTHIVKWWGPNGFTNTTHQMNVKPGGLWKHTMHGPDGTDFPNVVKYKEVVKPEKLVYTLGADENEENSFHITVTFEDVNGKTQLTMRSLFPTKEVMDFVIKEHGAIEGGKQTMNKLEEYLKSIQ